LTLLQHKSATASADLLRNGKTFNAATTLTHDLRICASRINGVLKAIDPIQYAALVDLNIAIDEKYPHVMALRTIDPLLLEGRAIMFNRQTPEHLDEDDPWNSWAFLLVLGNFKQGHLYIPRLKLRLFYEPGVLVAIRGRILSHEVEAWIGGQRISIAHFMHKSLWDEFGKVCP
jgi:hypothetical protein